MCLTSSLLATEPARYTTFGLSSTVCNRLVEFIDALVDLAVGLGSYIVGFLLSLFVLPLCICGLSCVSIVSTQTPHNLQLDRSCSPPSCQKLRPPFELPCHVLASHSESWQRLLMRRLWSKVSVGRILYLGILRTFHLLLGDLWVTACIVKVVSSTTVHTRVSC